MMVNSGRTVFSQLIQHVAEKNLRNVLPATMATLTSGDLPVGAFAQLTYRESLRDIESCLRALQSKLSHMGSRRQSSRSTLADANESHDWRIFADF